MSYTEIQIKKGRKYYYRVKSVRKGREIKKMRVYLGVDLKKKVLEEKEREAGIKLDSPLNSLLMKEEKNRLEAIKEGYGHKSKENWENRYESFLAQFTYDSNAIEGNTLSLQETSFILFENRTPQGKSLREINEVVNHKKAFDALLEYKGDLNKKFICGLQENVVKNTLREDLKRQSGKYRSIQVYIRGAGFIPPAPLEARREMKNLLSWHTKNKERVHPLIVAAYVHAAFECIHPFVDGNGRVGRLVLNFMLHNNKYPMINIPSKLRLVYYRCLEEARKGELRPFVKFLYERMMSAEVCI